MSKLRSLLAQLDTASPEALKRDLGRLVDIVDKELDALAAERFFEWNSVTPLQRGTITAKFGELVRVDTTPGQPAPQVNLPEAKTTDIGKRVGVSRNYLSPTCLVVIRPAGTQLFNFATGGATLVASTLGIRDVVWNGASWEGRL